MCDVTRRLKVESFRNEMLVTRIVYPRRREQRRDSPVQP